MLRIVLRSIIIEKRSEFHIVFSLSFNKIPEDMEQIKDKRLMREEPRRERKKHGDAYDTEKP